MFQQKGVVNITISDKDADELSLLAIDAGAEDVNITGDTLEIYTAPHDIEKVRHSLEEKGLTITSAEISREPQNTIELDEKKALQTVKLLEKLEGMDDVQKVYSNMDFSEEVMKQLAEAS
jgi:transcriptional/translational regulatory protein YebC/TACO1